MVPTITTWELVLRLVVTAVLCGLIGLERETRDRAAGMRTHILVGCGAALFTLVGAYGFSDFLSVSGAGGATQRLVDPTRVAAQIVSGIGFLGAGVIIRQGISVRGVTTAASLWCVAAIGLAVAAGFYAGAVAVTVIALVSLIGLRKLRPVMLTKIKPNRGVLVLCVENTTSVGDVLLLLHRQEIEIKNVVEEEVNDGNVMVSISLKDTPGTTLDEDVPMGKIRGIRGVLSADLAHTRYAGESAPD